MSIKDCPQPDPPELVMRADGYHYQEDEMDDLTLMQQAVAALENKDLSRWSSDMDRVTIAALHAAIAPHAPADREPQDEEQSHQESDGCPTEKSVLQRFWREHQIAGAPVAWLLTDENINHIQVDSVQRLIDRARLAHFTDLIIRINGKDEHYEADWLKHLVRATPPLNAPPPRTYEQEHAIKEGHRNKIEDDYFDARPNFNQVHHRAFFSGGFDRGWDAAKKDAPADRDVMAEALATLRAEVEGSLSTTMG